MYVGYWVENINYKMGDIVYVEDLLEYYICINDHLSNNLSLPNKEDLYWLYISSSFLNNFMPNCTTYEKICNEQDDKSVKSDKDDKSVKSDICYESNEDNNKQNKFKNINPNM